MRWQKLLLALFFLGFLVLCGVSLYLWQRVRNFEPVVYFYVPPDKSFVYSQEESTFGLEGGYIKDIIEREMARLKNEKNNFIYADLKNMKLTLYKEGEGFNSFPIIAKGADWFWGKTPPGIYQIDVKSRTLFSSIAKVWMPYAMRFYGNYFVHGWPYTTSGRLIRGTTSGGCIRLNTKDAEVVFNFVELGTPILIFDEEEKKPLRSLTFQDNPETILPKIHGENILVADLDTGEIIIEKDARSQISAGPATLMVLALTAIESVNLEKRIISKKWMYKDVSEGIIVPEKSYQGNSLMEIMLSRSSTEAALVLSRFLTPEKMLSLMNYKVKSLGMLNTSFVEITGTSSENTTSFYDMAKFMRYIKNYRKPIFDHIKKGVFDYSSEKNYVFISLDVKQPDYLDFDSVNQVMDHSQDSDSLNNASSTTRAIFIVIANSSDVKSDLENIINWINESLKLKKFELYGATNNYSFYL